MKKEELVEKIGQAYDANIAVVEDEDKLMGKLIRLEPLAGKGDLDALIEVMAIGAIVKEKEQS